MPNLQSKAQLIAGAVAAAPITSKRRLIAIIGPPASGKSTLAEATCAHFNDAGAQATVVPMDGFHLDNSILDARGLRARKGAPETFDAAGFAALVVRIKSEDNVVFPTFDRHRDISIAGSGVVSDTCDTVVFEGNYLLLDAPVWRELFSYWDFTVSLEVAEDVIHARLLQRWVDHGLPLNEAKQKASGNDLRNAKLVMEKSLPVDLVITN